MSVYAIQAVDGGPIKVGYSTNPEVRLAQLQTAHHTELVVTYSFAARPEYEHRIHEHLTERLLRGEWYEDHVDVWLALKATRAAAIVQREVDATVKDLVALVGDGLTRETVELRLAALAVVVADELLGVEYEAIDALQAFKSREDVRV